MLETKVGSNKIEADKIGGWSSNYSVGICRSSYDDKVGIWGSIYTELQVGI
jgi:hypothetical protein